MGKFPHFKGTEKLKEGIKSVRKTSHATYNINYHFIWIPKYRKPILSHPKVKAVLEKILYGQSRFREWDVLALEIQPDHVHLFLSCPPVWSPSEIINLLKGNTSRQLRLVFPYLKAQIRDSLWADGYYVGTAGHVSAEQVRRYIDEQNKHLFIKRAMLDKETHEALNKTLEEFYGR
jgi:putative transposase